MPKKAFEDKSVDPLMHFRTKLWCIYGYECFPRYLPCVVIEYPQYPGINPAIWGYSVYKRKPGYRTLGQDLKVWSKDHQITKFFLSEEDAIKYLKHITQVKCDVP